MTLVFFASCHKSDFMDSLNFQKFLLSGSGNYHNTEHRWFLDSLTVNGTSRPLTIKEKLYSRTFSYNGTFFDSDGYTGKWDIKKEDELTILFKNNLTASYVESKWLIKDISSTRLTYQVTAADNSKYDYYFKISYE